MQNKDKIETIPNSPRALDKIKNLSKVKNKNNTNKNVKKEDSVPERLNAVNSFIVSELDKSEAKEIKKQNILFLKEEQLVSIKNNTISNLSAADMKELKIIIRDVVSEELDNRGLSDKT